MVSNIICPSPTAHLIPPSLSPSRWNICRHRAILSNKIYMIVREFPFPPILKPGFNKHCSFISCWNILLWPHLGKVYKFALQIWIQAFRLILYASFSSIWLCSHVGHPMSNHRSNYLVARICRMHRIIDNLKHSLKTVSYCGAVLFALQFCEFIHFLV